MSNVNNSLNQHAAWELIGQNWNEADRKITNYYENMMSALLLNEAVQAVSELGGGHHAIVVRVDTYKLGAVPPRVKMNYGRLAGKLYSDDSKMWFTYRESSTDGRFVYFNLNRV